MKKILIYLFICLPIVGFSQAGLQILGTSGNFYINHTAAPKESFYSIGRLYNASPKEIPTYNNTTIDGGISIGQILKIPLNETNFTQITKPATDETTVPLYHVLAVKETLYQLSTTYNKIPVATLKSWNKLTDDNVPTGKSIIVGYLKVKTSLSTLAKQGVQINIPKPEKPIVNTPVVAEKKVLPKPIPEPETAPTKEIVITKPTPAPKKVEPINTNNSKTNTGSYFKNDYNNEGQKDTGIAGIFKSTSGWDDGKYYCLYTRAQQHTIVKITNKNNGKFIYAKVLDAMPDLKQNNNLQILISNAASSELGSENANFDCIIEY